MLLFASLMMPSVAIASPTFQLVSANPHPVVVGGPVPLEAVANSPYTNANAYHINSGAKVATVLGYSSQKPKILSDDSDGISVAQVRRWIDSACNGGEHYEHFDQPLNMKATTGATISTINTFPSESREVLEKIRDGSCVSALEPGGVLTQIGTEFYWTVDDNSEPVSLVGFSAMGAVTGLNFDIPAYLGTLASYGVNLTRIWVVEQWTALAVNRPAGILESNGLTPWTGTLSKGWILVGKNSPNSQYYARLAEFVDTAADLGIVVQITLFDRHGVINETGAKGRWEGSPYNDANNNVPEFEEGPEGKAPPSFLNWPFHSDLVYRLSHVLRGRTNVIWEILNEPHEVDWPAPKIFQFHTNVGQILYSGPPPWPR